MLIRWIYHKVQKITVCSNYPTKLVSHSVGASGARPYEHHRYFSCVMMLRWASAASPYNWCNYTTRGHNLRFFDDVIFVPVCRLNRSAIASLLSRFKRQTGAKRTSQKPQIVAARSIIPLSCGIAWELDQPHCNAPTESSTTCSSLPTASLVVSVTPHGASVGPHGNFSSRSYS